jgi:hypothetical protein
MGALDTLKLVNVVRKREISAEGRMRHKVVASLNQQAEMVQAELEGRQHSVTVRRYVEQDGQRVLVQRAKQPRKWFWKDANGAYLFQMSYCNTPVVIAGGQTTVEVGKLDALPAVINTLVQAVNTGELDAALKANQKNKPTKKARTPVKK